MIEEKMFEQMGETLKGYAPEVPGHIYKGVQSKLAWSRFFKFNASSLNIYYVGLATAALAFGLGTTQVDSVAMASSASFDAMNLDVHRTAVQLNAPPKTCDKAPLACSFSAHQNPQIAQALSTSEQNIGIGTMISTSPRDFVAREEAPSFLSILQVEIPTGVDYARDLQLRDQLVRTSLIGETLDAQLENKMENLVLRIEEKRTGTSSVAE